MQTIPLLDTPLLAATYQEGIDLIRQLAKDDRPHAVAFANTHLVALAKTDPSFRATLNQFSAIFPDGQPLVKLLNKNNAGLQERVYGPTFMQLATEQLSRPLRHFFVGGDPQTSYLLQAALLRKNPELSLCGTLYPPFKPWGPDDVARHSKTIANQNPDFIWVALGGGNQERWIAAARPHFKHGVLLGVGNAFKLLSGEEKFAPQWMQKHCLTWFYRTLQSPKLIPRYLKFNSLFLLLALQDHRKTKH